MSRREDRGRDRIRGSSWGSRCGCRMTVRKHPIKILEDVLLHASWFVLIFGLFLCVCVCVCVCGILIVKWPAADMRLERFLVFKYFDKALEGILYFPSVGFICLHGNDV